MTVLDSVLTYADRITSIIGKFEWVGGGDVVLLTARGDSYEATMAKPGEPQFVPGVAIRVLARS